jgi:hypothetical protein
MPDFPVWRLFFWGGKTMFAKIRSYLYCLLVVALAGALLALLAAFTQLQRAGAQVPAEERRTSPADERRTSPADERRTSPAEERRTSPADERRTSPAEERRTSPADERRVNLPVLPEQGASAELVVIPNPPMTGEPTELRVTLFNSGDTEIWRYAEFFISPLGIGQPLTPISPRLPFSLPPHAAGAASTVWVPPGEGPFCFYAHIFDSPSATTPIAAYQNNVIFRGHPDPSQPGVMQAIPVPVRNPGQTQATFDLSLSLPPGAAGWQARAEPAQVALAPGQTVTAHAVFTYTGGQLPPGGMAVFPFSASSGGLPAGAVDIHYGPPLRLHMGAEPPWAEAEISVTPYPIPPGEPAEVCAEIRNVTDQPRDALVSFRAAALGIALPSEPMAPPQGVLVPGRGRARPCIHWVAPPGGQFSFEVQVETPGYPLPVSSLRVLDVNEVLLPGASSELHFPVRNPFSQPVTISLGLEPLLPGLSLSLYPDVLQDMLPQEIRPVTLTVGVPAGVSLPPDGAPVVDVQAFVMGTPIGGLRKIYRPPVPIHQPHDPIYAEGEITVNPYPPREREPTEICVELRNPTDISQTFTVDFNVAPFGIGLPFHPIAAPRPVYMPAQSIVKTCIFWVPPFGGRFGVEVGIQLRGHARIYSQRVIDVGEILLPNQPSPFEFEVGNPYTFPISVTLGAVLHLPQWQVSFNPPALQLPPGGVAPVEMVVNPVQQPGDPEPVEGQPVIDVEAYWQGDGKQGLLGGFRKLFFPPVPVHRPEGPPYAESEIGIMPYPPRAGEPTRLEFEARNPTTATQVISVTFEWGNLGIGLPFTSIGAPQQLSLPPQGAGVVGIMWVPPFGGEFCVRVRVDAAYFSEPFYSSRNISIVRLPEPYGAPEVFQFPVGDNGDPNRPLTITLGLRGFLPDWQIALAQSQVVLAAGQTVATGTLTITPPADPADLPVDGGPIADISGYIDGMLIGGIRKVWRPPVPLGQLGEPGYAESEIVITPYPPLAGHPTHFAAQVRNNSDHTQNISVQFGWADFGFGIPFTTTGVAPTQTALSLGAHMTATVGAQWTPPRSGDFCVQILLDNPETQETLRSQRNVHVEQVPGATCTPIVQDFWLQNSTALTVTVTLGASAINLPPGWTYSVDPEEVILGPYEGITVTVTVTPPCAPGGAGAPIPLAPAADLSSPAVLQVEGYDQDGALVGGVAVELVAAQTRRVFLPVISRK